MEEPGHDYPDDYYDHDECDEKDDELGAESPMENHGHDENHDGVNDHAYCDADEDYDTNHGVDDHDNPDNVYPESPDPWKHSAATGCL